MSVHEYKNMEIIKFTNNRSTNYALTEKDPKQRGLDYTLRVYTLGVYTLGVCFLHQRIWDLNSRTLHSGGLHPGRLHSAGVLSPSTDLVSELAHSTLWGSTLWGPTLSSYRFGLQQPAYLSLKKYRGSFNVYVV